MEFDFQKEWRTFYVCVGSYTLFEGELDGLTGNSETIGYFPRNIKNALDDTGKFKFGDVITSKAIEDFKEDVAVETMSKIE